STGRLVATFDNNPQLPFNEFVLGFRQGQTAPLVSPPECGAYTAVAELTPWSAPEEVFNLTSSFEITKGVGGGPCPSGGVPPFAPKVIAGPHSNVAGAYS